MSNKNQAQDAILYQLIREVFNSSVSYDSSKEKLVTINTKGRYKASKLGSFFGSYKHYLVNYVAPAEYKGYVHTLNKTYGANNIHIDYKIKCNLKDAALFAENIFAASNNPISLLTLIQTEIENFDKRFDLSVDLYTKKDQVASIITDRFKELGLTVMLLDLYLDQSSDALKPIPVHIAGFKVPLRDVIPQAKIGISCTATIIRGREANSLNCRLTGAILETELIRITRRYLSQHVTAEDLYKDHRTTVTRQLELDMNSYLKELCREITDLSISLNKPGTLNPIVIVSDGDIGIRVSNSHQLLSLSYTCELVADPNSRAKAILFSADTLEVKEVIQDEIKNAFANDIDLEQFANELNTSIPLKLGKAINSRISSWGRIAGYIELKTTTVMPPAFVEVDTHIVCTTKDNKKISVKNTLLLQLDYNSHRIFEAHQIKDYHDWGNEQLKQVNKSYVIGRSFNELKYQFNSSDIKNELVLQANKLGYNVKQLVTIPLFNDTDIFGGRFHVKYKQKNLNSKADGIYLSISVEVEGRIQDLDKTLMLLKPTENISDHIRDTIDVKLRQYFRSVDPNRFYLRFYEGEGGQGTLEQEIKNIVSDTIRNDYGADIRTIIVNQENTDLITRLKNLQKGILDCDFNDNSGLLSYRTTISINGIDPASWSVFNARDYNDVASEKEAIKTHVKNYLENILNYVIRPAIKNGDLSKTKSIAEEASKYIAELCDEIRSIFGLNIQILKPVKIDIEGKTNQMRIEIENRKREIGAQASIDILTKVAEERIDRLKKLYDERRKMIGEPANNPQLERIKKEIEQLEAYDDFNNYTQLTTSDPVSGSLDNGDKPSHSSDVA